MLVQVILGCNAIATPFSLGSTPTLAVCEKKSIESDPIELGKTDIIGMATEPIGKPGVISEEKSDEKDNNDFGCGGAVGGRIHGSGQST